jgi:hypothetical protein
LPLAVGACPFIKFPSIQVDELDVLFIDSMLAYSRVLSSIET